MTKGEKIIICCLAAIIPLLVVLYRVDYENISNNYSAWAFVGYCARSAVLFLSALIVVFLYPSENDRIKLFHLALAAPALLTTFVEKANVTTAAVSIIGIAYAQESQELGKWPEPSALSKFLQGFTGAPKKLYWVQLKSEPTKEEAIEDVNKLRRDNIQLSYKFQAYPSYSAPGHYAVMMEGPFADYGDARVALQTAIEKKFSTNPYIFELPRANER